MKRFVRVLPSRQAAAEAAAELFAATATEAVAARGVFRVALSGGTTPLLAYRLLGVSPWADVVPWSHVDLYFGDERCVPECHVDRNDLAAREAFLSHVPLPPERVHPVAATLPDGAERYEALIRERFRVPSPGTPRFDLVFLGLGADGHTASLFPEHPALAETARLVVRVDGCPRPPSSRVTFTLPLLSAAARVVFLVTGEEKRNAVARVLAGDLALPASHVAPFSGETVFLLDPDSDGR